MLPHAPGPLMLATMMEGGDASWWKLAGALIVVFALLIVFLKLLGRFQQGGGGGEAALLKIHSLGPRRGVEILRCGGTVYTLYRNDQSMVLLDQEPYDPQRHDPVPTTSAVPEFLRRFRSGGQDPV